MLQFIHRLGDSRSSSTALLMSRSIDMAEVGEWRQPKITERNIFVQFHFFFFFAFIPEK